MEKEALSTEYPKSLYQGGDRTAPERVVRSDEEEVAARAEGFKMIDKERDAEAVTRLGLDEADAPEVKEPKAKKAK